MGLWSRLLGLDPQNGVSAEEMRREIIAGSGRTATGVAVTSDTAVASVAVLACVTVRAESLALCPVDVGRRDGRNRIPTPEHPVARLVGDEWNPFLSAEEGWRWKQITSDLRGGAFVRVEWRGGKPVNLWPLTAAKPELVFSDVTRSMAYRYTGDDFTEAGDYPANQILHFKGPLLSNSPYEARSLIEVTAENIGLGIATEQFFARFLGNGDHFPKYLHTPNALTDADFKALKKQLEDGAGLLPAGKTRIFDRGLEVKQNQMSLKDADLTEHQRWILEQVCRTFRVPPPMVQDWTHGTYTNSEQADLWLAKHTTAPIARNDEGVIRRGLFLPNERPTYYAKFNLNAMMRGDFAARTAGYALLINSRIMNPNEARALEDWNPYDGGDEFWSPLNTAPVGSDAAANPGASAPANALAPLLGDAKERIRARHVQDQERGRDADETLAFAHKVLAPIADAAQGLGIDFDTHKLAALIIEED